MTNVFNHERETARSSANDIRVVLADDHQLFRQGLKALLELERGIMLLMSISDGSSLAVLAAPTCDIGLVGYEMTLLVDRVGQQLAPQPRAGLYGAQGR